MRHVNTRKRKHACNALHLRQTVKASTSKFNSLLPVAESKGFAHKQTDRGHWEVLRRLDTGTVTAATLL